MAVWKAKELFSGPTHFWAWPEKAVPTALKLIEDKTLWEPTTVPFPTD